MFGVQNQTGAIPTATWSEHPAYSKIINIQSHLSIRPASASSKREKNSDRPFFKLNKKRNNFVWTWDLFDEKTQVQSRRKVFGYFFPFLARTQLIDWLMVVVSSFATDFRVELSVWGFLRGSSAPLTNEVCRWFFLGPFFTVWRRPCIINAVPNVLILRHRRPKNTTLACRHTSVAVNFP